MTDGISDKVLKQIDTCFNYKERDEVQTELCMQIRLAAHQFATFLAERLTEGRDLSLALTSLQQVVGYAEDAVDNEGI